MVIFAFPFRETVLYIREARKRSPAHFPPSRNCGTRNKRSLGDPANLNDIFNHSMNWYLDPLNISEYLHCSQSWRKWLFLFYLRFLSQKWPDASPERLRCWTSLPRLHCHRSGLAIFCGGFVKSQLQTFHNRPALGHWQGQIHQIELNLYSNNFALQTKRTKKLLSKVNAVNSH